MVILKGGRSEIGSRAAVSHTASLVGSFQIWANAIKQAGGVLVETFEDLIDTMKYLKMIGLLKLENVCLASLSGGYGVICSDTLAEHNINLPYFKDGTKIRENLSKLFTEKGTSYNNPIDLAVTIYDPAKLEKIFRTILDDSSVDGIIFEIAALYLVYSMKSNINLSEELFKMLSNIKKDYKKPFLVIIQDIGFREAQNSLKDKLQSINIPVYSDILHIARTIKKLNIVIEEKSKRNLNQ
jgi:acetate---CoA ligase (ADP-forming)